VALAKGYDVSDYQSSIPADAQFVIVKATEGARTNQSNYRAKLATARGRNLVVGHYHFLHAENDIAGEIAHFCDVVGDVPAGELLVLDFEPYNQGVSASVATAKKNQWLAAVKQRYPRNRVGIYTNTDWWFKTDDNAGDFLWIADYQRPAGSPGIQAAWRIHQYTDKPLDTNVYNGSIDDMRAWANSTAAPAPRPSGKPSWQRLVDHVLSIPEGDYETYRSGVGWDNVTRFGKQFGEDGVAWCVIFDWCMYADVGLEAIVPKTDNVNSFTAWAKQRGQWSEYPSLGAWVNFSNGAHTEIVVGFDATTVTTKGGNTIPTGGDGGQGRGVYKHTYRRTDPRIVGYLAPRFPDGRPPSADPRDPRPVMAAVQEDDMDAAEVWNYTNPDLESRDAYQILRDIDAKVEGASAPAGQVDATAVAAALAGDPAFAGAVAAAFVALLGKKLGA
jgi:GH25 family lysozyme M1 (1,4-beta-N-acetylmuramidase)